MAVTPETGAAAVDVTLEQKAEQIEAGINEAHSTLSEIIAAEAPAEGNAEGNAETAPGGAMYALNRSMTRLARLNERLNALRNDVGRLTN